MKKFAIKSVAVIFLVTGMSTVSLAHESKITPQIAAGADRFFEYGIDAQTGLMQSFPAYLAGRVLRNQVEPLKDNSSSIYRLAAGTDWRNWGAHAFGQHSMDVQYQAKMINIGGRLDLKLVRWSDLSKEEDILLSDQDKEEIKEERAKEAEKESPNANRISIEYTNNRLVIPSGLSPTTNFRSVGGYLLWHVIPTWVISPGFYSFQYSSTPEKDLPNSVGVYSSPLIQLGKIGPDQVTSRVPGLISYYAQGYTRVEVSDDLGLAVASSRFLLKSTGLVAWDFWLGIDKYLDPAKKHWKVTPAYEHVIKGGKTYSFFALSLQYAWNNPYQP